MAHVDELEALNALVMLGSRFRNAFVVTVDMRVRDNVMHAMIVIVETLKIGAWVR